MTPTCRLEDVLGRAVRAHDLRLGTVTGVVFDAGRERVLGLEVAGRDGVRRFSPWVAVELVGNATAIASRRYSMAPEHSPMTRYSWASSYSMRR